MAREMALAPARGIQRNGSYTLTIPYADETELVMDIMRHGADVESWRPTPASGRASGLCAARIRRLGCSRADLRQRAVRQSRGIAWMLLTGMLFVGVTVAVPISPA